MKPNRDDWERAAKICREVAELPDRTSPDENGDFMLVTGDELQPMLATEFAAERARIIAALREPSPSLARAGGMAVAEDRGHPGFTPWAEERRTAEVVMAAVADWLEKTHAKTT